MQLACKLRFGNLIKCISEHAFQGVNLCTMADAQSQSEKRSSEDPGPDAKRLCEDPNSVTERIKKRKVVLLMGYCGQGYLGMQRNMGFKTIEEDLLNAFLKANLINEESFNQIQTMQFQRAARTDKGVSAVRQVVSLKLPENCVVDDINKHLPDAIRVFAMKRVTKGFNSKTSCDARTYSYMLPTFAFSVDNESESYRITPDVIDKIKEALLVFTGTHNFHNFTAKKKAQDPSAFRYILNFECDEPFVHDGLELITLRVKGQSFMLHQIRKMVGTVIAIVRGVTSVETITKAWGEARFDLPIAPGLGLVLEQVHYDRYNARYGKDGLHECLVWDEYEEEIQRFKREHIDPVIVQTEKNEKSMYAWIQNLPFHTFDLREQHLHQLRNGEEKENETKSDEVLPEDLQDQHLHPIGNGEEKENETKSDEIPPEDPPPSVTEVSKQ